MFYVPNGQSVVRKDIISRCWEDFRTAVPRILYDFMLFL